ncbi:hypothetical protein ACP275_12G087000 [Erythranthe tilingii]
MLEPRETELPALFLVFIVLPLVSYFLLGKWSESAKSKERLSLIAADESLQFNNMAVAAVMPPVVHLPNGVVHQCARCSGQATTRCSQCKSVRYCSGRCQILHWRQVHKLECQQLGKDLHRFEEMNSLLDDNNGEFSRTGFTVPTFSQPLEDAYVQKGDFFSSENHANKENVSHKTKSFNCSSERTLIKRSNKSRIVLSDNGIELHKSPKSRAKVSNEPLHSDINAKAQPAHESRVASINDNSANTGIMSMKKSVKIDRGQHLEERKMKMIFPYEEFVKCFQFEALNFTPRGLVNCGNSCYANAVLQCLTYTKPLIVYLLRQSHSTAGCTKDWCLVCELEQFVQMLRENEGPLTPVNILIYIRSLNSQIGDGSQEDAHEFLRLLVASMQSISLESFGGENAVNPILQNTTFIQHTFGGCLRSKVKCLRCNHESERYESMLDLTLEIFGWVESLEDALTQFTSLEDLDGENMYRCPRCAAYVRAWKQLKIQEAPNILTIVLKRFQEGNYGKINKCITFPEMLDMIPFMTGTDDIPPLYVLYAVVVHLDSYNASFSGHYISYVKDLHGNWFRVDDTEVQPVESSQVMSEGAYILFYMRSSPRHTKSCNTKATGKNTDYNNSISRGILVRENRSRSPSTLKNYIEEFSDATSNDYGSHLTTSSDDSSFTTESTRDSFSAETFPVSSIFHSWNIPEEYSTSSTRTISCSVLPAGSRPLTRFAREEKGFVSVYGGTSYDDGVHDHVYYTSGAGEAAPQLTSYFSCTM